MLNISIRCGWVFPVASELDPWIYVGYHLALILYYTSALLPCYNDPSSIQELSRGLYCGLHLGHPLLVRYRRRPKLHRWPDTIACTYLEL